MIKGLACLGLSIISSFLCIVAQLHPADPAQYQTLPFLRDQARILDEWRYQRLQALPELMKRYNIDAWLVSISILNMNIY